MLTGLVFVRGADGSPQLVLLGALLVFVDQIRVGPGVSAMLSRCGVGGGSDDGYSGSRK